MNWPIFVLWNIHVCPLAVDSICLDMFLENLQLSNFSLKLHIMLFSVKLCSCFTEFRIYWHKWKFLIIGIDFFAKNSLSKRRKLCNPCITTHMKWDWTLHLGGKKELRGDWGWQSLGATRTSRRHGGNNFLGWKGHVCNNLWGWQKIGEWGGKKKFWELGGRKFGECWKAGRMNILTDTDVHMYTWRIYYF